ncbi:folylpolyglutamate synthase [Listeria weihenstephanensis FSL R9-0317]|uniref:Dihydrofolate synthase/folylpolyglutamate synthase n=1 Tax=Listeria weihenstephanensis TaxID=1006155 RepID=A0A1S7FV80_9LIST|nr:folylpolyglutamate synthase/dihydrofolate synthase family protein [Listeria weihenstephanensis]AQY51280.1 folylpolyglutamate synthase [Listeria weihenstephanensis]EUJ36781.1 folylpolyglutamate synthase [Listeria weihenstephanensis FSL R9-0317]
MYFKEYSEAITWIHGTLRMGIKPGLKRMEYMLTKLDHPENKNKWVHIAGTNGKGSTLTFIRNVLEQSGYKVGTFTSPYIESFNERISINGIPVDNDAIITLCNRIKPLADELADTEWGHPSEFEIITVMMFLYFAEYATIDIGLVEVGLGGRLDSTNVITPLISVVTTIGMDHMEFLGNTIHDIALEKAGIFKPDIPIVSGVIQVEVQELYKVRADDLGSAIYQLGVNFIAEKDSNQRLSYAAPGLELTNIPVGLLGDHQLNNAAVALKTVELLKEKQFQITDNQMRAGLKGSRWPGRLEKMQDSPTIYLDGAHNIEGIKALVKASDIFHGEPVKLLFTALQDKEFVEMIKLLKTIENVDIFLTTFDYPRALSVNEIEKIASENDISFVLDWKMATGKWAQDKSENVIMVTGSLYFIAEVRKMLL